MDDCIDCIETVARLHMYIDRELSTEEITIVQQHLQACPECEGRFHFDMRVKRLLHEHCAIARAPEHLRQAVLHIARMSQAEIVELDSDLKMGLKADLE